VCQCAEFKGGNRLGGDPHICEIAVMSAQPVISVGANSCWSFSSSMKLQIPWPQNPKACNVSFFHSRAKASRRRSFFKIIPPGTK
jgi:hypothetical protein